MREAPAKKKTREIKPGGGRKTKNGKGLKSTKKLCFRRLQRRKRLDRIIEWKINRGLAQKPSEGRGKERK